MTCNKCGFTYYMAMCQVCNQNYFCGYCDTIINSCVKCSQKSCNNCKTSKYLQNCFTCEILYCVNCVYPVDSKKDKKDKKDYKLCWDCYYFANKVYDM